MGNLQHYPIINGLGYGCRIAQAVKQNCETAMGRERGESEEEI